MKSLFSPRLGLACCLVLGFSSTAFASISASNNAGTYKASWSVTGGNTLNVTIEAATSGWVGIGFSKTATMDDTDFFIGGVSSNGYAYGADSFYNPLNNTHSAPLVDAAQNVYFNATEANGVTTINFSRLLNTGDTVGDYDLSNGSYSLLWAFRTGTTPDDTTKFHGGSGGGFGVLASNVNFVPLPSAFWFLGSGLMALWGYARKTR
ncbi:MAG: DOMON domain-containing protein [Methylococcales bacterium]